MDDFVKISFNLSKNNYEKLQKCVEETGYTQTGVIRVALNEFFQKGDNVEIIPGDIEQSEVVDTVTKKVMQNLVKVFASEKQNLI